MSESDLVRLDRMPSGVAILSVNRPERGNAMTIEMAQQFQQYLAEADSSRHIKVLIITGSENVFLSGADVGRVTSKAQDMDPSAWREFRDIIYERFRSLYTMRKPTIAAVNGAAVVGGVDVAVSCDLRIASENAEFRIGFRRMGLMPTPAICFILPRIIGPGWTKLMAYTDKPLGAADALRLGLVEEVVPHDTLLPRAIELAEEIALGPQLMISATKEAIIAGLELDFERLRRQIDNAQFVLSRSEDHREAIRAFAEKRTPRFGVLPTETEE